MIKILVDKNDLYYRILAEAISDELEEMYPEEKLGYISALKDVFNADLVIICGDGDFPKGISWAIGILKKPLVLYHVSPDTTWFNRLAKRSDWIVSPRVVSGYDYFPSPVFTSDLATPRHIERIWNRERLTSRRGSIGIIGLILKETQLQKLTDALNLLIEDLDLNIVFIPILKEESVRGITVKYSANTRYVQTDKYSAKEVLGIISRIDLLISTNEKGIICAMSVDKPVVGLAISDELDQLLGGVGEEEVLLDIDKLSGNELYSKIKIAWVHRDTIAREMIKKSTMLKKEAGEGIRRLGKWTQPFLNQGRGSVG